MTKNIVTIICAALLALGIGFIRITQHQEQENDQSQNTVVNTITKTVIVNYTSGKKYKNIKWKIKNFSNLKQLFEFFNKDLNEWQRESAKYVPICNLIYREVDTIPIVFTNKSSFKNRNYSINTNTFKVGTIFSKIKSLWNKEK